VAIPDTEWDKKTRLNLEREMLGLYVSDHPLLGIEHVTAKDTDFSAAELKTTVVRLDDKLRVTARPALHADLKQFLGPSCIAS
jgi:DNA polymerase III subunit alpha